MLVGLTLAALVVLACAGVALDAVFGEPSRAHPLVAFGRIAERLEARFNHAARCGALAQRLRGAGALAIVVGMPVLVLAVSIAQAPVELAAALHAVTLYFVLGAKSLGQHARAVADALAGGELVRARALAARMVTRDLHDASAQDVARAAVESTLENGNDAVFGALFWFAIGGASGALAYRLVNTLDAMWGYRTPRYLHFGWAAARLDDLMNYLPARLTATTYALLGDTRRGLTCWRVQAPTWESPNAGPVMASGAGALGVALGGAARYHGRMEYRPPLGAGLAPQATDIRRALRLMRSGIVLWLAALAVLTGASAYA